MELRFNPNHLPVAAYLVVAYSNAQKNVNFIFDTSKDHLEFNEKIQGNFTVAKYVAKELKNFNLIGNSNESHVDTWIEYASTDLNVETMEDADKAYQYLDYKLQNRTYLAQTHYPTLADFAVYEVLKNSKIWKGFQARFGSFVPHLVRFFNHLDKKENIKKSFDELTDAVKKKSSTKDVIEINQNKEKVDPELLEVMEAMKDINLPNAKVGEVVTRFPPEPSGYLHIGHSKAAMLNYFIAKKYSGKLILRFDDTNPAKEKKEFELSILDDLKRLNIKYDKLTYSSDSFPIMEKYCEQMIKQGKAYVDNTPKEEMGELRKKGLATPCRERPVEESLSLWEEMKKGSTEGKKCCVRAKIDVTSPNFTLRDPVLYRCKDEVHPRTGDKYKAYPTYDFTCPIVDSIEGVTHACRTSEYNDRNHQYYWIVEALGLRKIHIYDFSRLNLTYTLMSKRKLQNFVNEGVAESWRDPRFPTIQGLMRRGLTIQGLRKFIQDQLGSRSSATLDIDKLWSLNKQIIDPIVPRFTCIRKDKISTMTITNVSSELTVKENPKHPKNSKLGTVKTQYSNVIYIEFDDAKDLAVGEEVTLRYWGNMIIKSIESSSNGGFNITAEFNEKGSVKDTKKKLTWIAKTDKLVDVELVYYEPILTKPKLTEEMEKEFVKYVNTNSKHNYQAFGDSNLSSLKETELLQLERIGYFITEQSLKDNKIILFNTPEGGSSSEEKKPEEKKN